ncbi:MAG TPA: nucleoside transporter C-terminal domain-containing protein [Burkholderiales bacterium]|nr:nucleoside transporter C-terminal domain-containing protein [Burkholderiales bacterium]
MPLELQSAFGLVILLLIAWLVGERRSVPWRIVIGGLALQLALALLLLKAPPLQAFFLALNDALGAMERATRAGTSLVFGYLGGADVPFDARPGSSTFVLAFRALPLVLVMSALSALLFYWRVLPLVVRAMSAVLEKTLGIGGAVGLSTAANVFIGMVEAPLTIRPYLKALTRGELFMVMTGGMAGIAGTVMALYASILGPVIPDAMGHILAASVISAPAALVCAALMIAPGDQPTSGRLAAESRASSAMEAVTQGTIDGLALLLNIVALLIVLVALVTLANFVLALLPAVADAPLTLQRMLGWIMAPVTWLVGIPWQETHAAGALMGTKTVLNELIAYVDMAALPPDALSPRSRVLMTYALCGFANLGSLGIMIGGLAGMVPERRSEIVALGVRSIVSGTLATLVTAAGVGIFLR